MLRRHHVVVVILRKVRVHTVAGLAGFSVTDVIRQNDVVAGDIEELSRAKQHAGELRREELFAGPAGAVQKQHGVCDSAVRVAHRSAKGGVVHSQLRQGFTRLETDCGKRSRLAAALAGLAAVPTKKTMRKEAGPLQTQTSLLGCKRSCTSFRARISPANILLRDASRAVLPSSAAAPGE